MSSKLKYPEYFLKENEKMSGEGKENMTLLKQMQNLRINKYARYLKGSLNCKDVKNKVNIPSGKEKRSRNEANSISKEMENNKSTLVIFPEEENKEAVLLDSSLVSYVKNGNLNLNSNGRDLNGNYHDQVIQANQPIQASQGHINIQQNTQEFISSGQHNLEVIFEQDTQRTETLNNTVKKSGIKDGQNNSQNLNSSKTDFENISTSINLSVQFNPQYTADYLMDIYYNLLDEQKEIKSLSGYMNLQTDINEKMRAILVDWIIDVHYKFKLTPETLFLTVNLIDRYLSDRNVRRDQLQLIGVVSLLIACKYEEIFSPELRDFEYITDKAYRKEEFTQLEIEMLKLFQFEITRPSPFRCFEIINTKLKFSQTDFSFGRYLLEMFLMDYRYTKYSASQIACSVSFLVISIKSEKVCEKTITKNSRRLNKFLLMQFGDQSSKEEDKEIFFTKTNLSFYETFLKDCCKDICFILENIDNTGLFSVKKKFSTLEFFRVAKLLSKLGN
jgi:hypothetical protein